MAKHSGKHQGIVVGVDGSPSSNTAVCWAAREAAMRNVSLSLIHVIERPPWGLLALGGGAVQPPPDALEWQRTEGAEIISAAVKIAKDSTQDRSIPDLHAECISRRSVRPFSSSPIKRRWSWSVPGAMPR